MYRFTLFQSPLFSKITGVFIALALLLSLCIPFDAFAADFLTNGSSSMNWAGYVAEGNNFTSVTGTWTIPTVTKNENDPSVSADAMWVGVGGVDSDTLIQAGTQAIVEGNEVMYEAWFEMLPRRSHTVPLGVSPGDSITVTINETNPDNWHILIQNNTTGERYERDVIYESSNSSVEWIAEAPATRRGILPLDRFGSVQFTNAMATVGNGSYKTAAELNAKPYIMLGQWEEMLASPSKLAVNGKDFTVTRLDEQTAMGIDAFPPQPQAVPIPSIENLLTSWLLSQINSLQNMRNQQYAISPLEAFFINYIFGTESPAR